MYYPSTFISDFQVNFNNCGSRFTTLVFISSLSPSLPLPLFFSLCLSLSLSLSLPISLLLSIRLLNHFPPTMLSPVLVMPRLKRQAFSCAFLLSWCFVRRTFCRLVDFPFSPLSFSLISLSLFLRLSICHYYSFSLPLFFGSSTSLYSKRLFLFLFLFLFIFSLLPSVAYDWFYWLTRWHLV